MFTLTSTKFKYVYTFKLMPKISQNQPPSLFLLRGKLATIAHDDAFPMYYSLTQSACSFSEF